MKKTCLFLLLFLSTMISFFSSETAHATTLPPKVLSYLHQKDAKVQVRFDGVVIFANGESYLPIIPQDPDINPDPLKAEPTLTLNSDTNKSTTADLIGFDNHFFLIRLIQTASGRLTLPKLNNIPIELKEGLLPQDLVIPANLFIPDELKVILGELPYKPVAIKESIQTPASQSLKQVVTDSPTKAPPAALIYAYDLDDQTLTAVDQITGRTVSKLELACIPASMKPSANGKYLYVSCLSNNEVVVVDTSANLITTRIPVGDKPGDLLVLDDASLLVVSHKFSNFISLVDTQKMALIDPVVIQLEEEKPDKHASKAKLERLKKEPLTKTLLPIITIPDAHPAAMASITKDLILVADSIEGKLYEINLPTREIIKTIPSIKNISGIWVTGSDLRKPEAWVISRTDNKLQHLEITSGTPLATEEIAPKPLTIQGFGDKLYILCAGADRIEVVDLNSKKIQTPIQLEEGTFPSSMIASGNINRAFVGGASKTGLISIDLSRDSIDTMLPTNFRTSMLAFTIINPGLMPGAVNSTPAQPDTSAPKADPTSIPLVIPSGLQKPETAKPQAKTSLKIAPANKPNSTQAFDVPEPSDSILK